MKTVSLALAGAFCALLACGAYAQSGKFPMVTVAADGTGDFGPQTPGTITSGIQEALNYCVSAQRDLYIKGRATYDVSDTIHIPATQDFRIDGGVYTLNWTGPPNKDMIWVDSGMDCHFYFGTLKYGGNAGAIRFKPQNNVPIDGFSVFIDSEVRITSIEPTGTNGPGAGIIYDPNPSGIVMVDFFIGNIEGLATGIYIPDSGAGVFNCRITCMNLHTNVSNATLLRLGANGNQNMIKVGISQDGTPTGVKGVEVRGSNNSLTVTTKGGLPAGNDLIFTGGASGNKANIIPNTLSSTDPTGLAGDTSSSPTNQITWTTGVPAAIRTLSVSTGTYNYTQRLYPATARVAGGAVSSVSLIRNGATINYGSTPTELSLSVGDTLRIVSTSAPTVHIIPRANG